MNRRNFISRAGLLLGSVGVAETFKLDLINKIGASILPKAHGATVVPKRQIEICFRAGIPMMMFATGREFTALNSPQYSNFSYAGNQILRSEQVSNLYFNQDSQSLMRHAANIAITQGVQVEGGHTNLFNYRQGAAGRGLTTPIVELADLNPTGSVIHGVQWPGAAINRNNQTRDLVRLANTNDFMNLFKNPVLALTKEELGSVLSAAQKLSRRQALLLEDKLENSLAQSDSQRKAAQMFAVDYSALLSTNGMAQPLMSTGSYAGVRTAFARSLKGMQHNLINSSMVVIDLGDWHGYQTDKQNATIIREISQIISSVVDFLKATPEPTNPALTLFDTTTIVAGSEFTRGISKFNIDNNDGGTQGIMLIGKNVRGNYYGGFTISDGATMDRGSAHGFDKNTGAVTMNMRNSPEQVYQTIRKLSGLEVGITDSDKVLNCMVA
jgi:hypothetical protein